MSDKTPLHEAALTNNCLYLQKNTINHEDSLAIYTGNTPLLWGIANSSVEFVVDYLDIIDGEHLNLPSTFLEHKNTPLILSVAKGWWHIASARPNSTPQSAVIDKLIAKGALINEVDARGRTALHYACIHRDLAAINALVRAGARWDISDNSGHTPIEYTVLQYQEAEHILRWATGGPKGYTFSLQQEHFESDFYKTLKSSAIDVPEINPLLLDKEFKRQLLQILSPIYQHAQSLFDQEESNTYSWSIFESSTIHGQQIYVSSVPVTEVMMKAQILLRLHNELKEAILTGSEDTRSKSVNRLFEQAFANPILQKERNILTSVAIALVNFLALSLAAIPLLINYAVNKQFFFAHRTQSEHVLHSVNGSLCDVLNF